jgi:hypothetical protein
MSALAAPLEADHILNNHVSTSSTASWTVIVALMLLRY